MLTIFYKNKLAKIVKFSKKFIGMMLVLLKIILRYKKIYAVEKKNKNKIGSIHLASLFMSLEKKNIIKLLEKFKKSQYAEEVIRLIKND